MAVSTSCKGATTISSNSEFDSLISALPRVESWIDQYISEHCSSAVPLVARGFSRLGAYFLPDTLRTARVVYVPKVVTPPLGALGIDGFTAFEQGCYQGITYKDYLFVESSHRDSESLHFHETVHIVQWRELGPLDFLFLYAKGLAEDGYDNCPLEFMAYRTQQEFENGTRIPDFEPKLIQMVRDEARNAGFLG